MNVNFTSITAKGITPNGEQINVLNSINGVSQKE